MELIQRRPPRAFSGERASGLRELYSATNGCLGIISLERITSVNKRYNTKAYVLVKENNGLNTKDQTKSVFYNRQTIPAVFTLAGIKTDDGYKIEVNSRFEHPIAQEEIIKILNGKYRCDFTDQDIVVTYINGNYYSVEALVNSLGYIGKATLAVGIEEEIPLIPTEHALFDSESSILNANIDLNGRVYPVASERLFTEENVIFHEFTKGDQSKLTYFLNLNEVSLTAKTTVDISSRPAGANLNETVRPSNGQFILSEFVRATTEIPVEPLDVPKEIRFTSWLNSIEKIDAIFDIKVNGVLTSLSEINEGHELVDIDTANNVLILSNKTYQPVDIYLRAKTISLPAMEDPNFTFIRVEDQPELVGGYEVYGYRLAALVKPLQNLVVKHWVPAKALYTTLMTRLSQVVGEPPEVVEENGVITEILQLNLNHDDYDTYYNILSVEGTAKTSNATLARNGVLFLDIFAINKEQWDILQQADLNAPLLQITRVNQGFEEVAAVFSVNQLLARGVWDVESEHFVFAFNCRDDWEGTTKFVYNSNGLFLPTTLTLSTTRDLTKLYLPKFFILEQAAWDELKQRRTDWANRFGPNAFTGTPTLLNHTGNSRDFTFTYNVVPTKDEIQQGYVNAGFLVAIQFHQDIKPILDRAMQRFNSADASKSLMKLIGVGPNLEAFNLTYGQYRNVGFQDFYHDEDAGIYTLVTRCTTRIDLDPNFDLGNGPSEVDRTDNVGSIQLSFDADSIYGSVFSGGDNIDRRNVINHIAFNSPNFKSPAFEIAANQATLFNHPMIQAKIREIYPEDVNANGPTDHLIINQTKNILEVNIKRIAGITSFWVITECLLTAEQYANMNKCVFADTDGNLFVGEEFKKMLVAFDGHYYLPFRAANPVSNWVFNLAYTVDSDGGELVYTPTTTAMSISINVINPPMPLFMLVDKLADDESQQNLLNHTISPGYTPITIPIASPFDAFKAPLMPILGLTFSEVANQTVVDGSVEGIDEQTIVGVEFKLFITEEELAAKPDNDDLVAIIRKVGTSWTLNLPRSLFKRQTYVKDGDVHLYMLFKLGELGGFNGEYTIEVDWDGIGTNDDYIINGVDHNSFYKQTLAFVLDLDARFLPRDLDSPIFYWTNLTAQREMYAKLYAGELSAPHDNPWLEPDMITFGKNGAIATVNAILPPDASRDYVLFVESSVTDETYPLMDGGTLKIRQPNLNNGNWIDADLKTIKANLFKYNGKYYYAQNMGSTVDSWVQELQVDLDASGKKYKVMNSRLEAMISLQPQIYSPVFGWATNQLQLLTALKAGTIVASGIDAATVIDPSRVEYGVLTSLDFNAGVVKDAQKVLVAFLEFQGTEEDYQSLNDQTTLTTRINGGNEVVMAWTQLQSKMVTFNNRHYLPQIYTQIQGIESNVMQLDVDGLGKLYLPSTVEIETNVAWYDQIASPKIILAPNQLELLTAAKVGALPADPKNPLDPAKLAEPAGMTYSISETSMTATYVGPEAKEVPVFAQIVATDSEFSKLGTQSKIAVVNTEGVEQLIPWADFLASVITYGGKRYLIVNKGISQGAVDRTYLIDTDSNKLRYTPTISTVSADIAYTASIASPVVKVAANQSALLAAIHSGSINTGKPASSYVLANEVIYGNMTDTTFAAEAVTAATKIIPVFAELVISDLDYAKLNDTSIVKIKEGNQTELTINGNALKAQLIAYGGKRYLISELMKASATSDTTFKIDLDGTGRYYLETTSNVKATSTWVTPIASPKLTFATNQVELLNAAIAGTLVIPGVEKENMVKTENITWNTLIADEYAVTILREDAVNETLTLATFLKVHITDDEVANVGPNGTMNLKMGANVSDVPLNVAIDQLVKFNNEYFWVVTHQTNKDSVVSNENAIYTVDYDGANAPYYKPTVSDLDLMINYLNQQQSPVFEIAQNIKTINDLIMAGEIVIPALGPIVGWVNSAEWEIPTINANTLDLIVTPSNASNNVVGITLKVLITDEVYGKLDQNTTLVLRRPNGEALSLGAGLSLKDMIYKYEGTYYMTFNLEREMSEFFKDVTLIIDVDGPGNLYIPKTSLINAMVTWRENIKCDDAPILTQCLSLKGRFQVKVDGQFVNDGNTLEQNEMITYFNTTHPEHGIAVDRCIDISCDGAPNQTQCVQLTGEWDVYIGDTKIGTDVASDDLPSLFTTGGQGVVMVPCEDTSGKTVSTVITGVNDISGPNIGVKLGNDSYEGGTIAQMAEYLTARGFEVVPLTKSTGCQPTDVTWNIPSGSPVLTEGNTVYAAMYIEVYTDVPQEIGTWDLNINGATVTLPSNIKITQVTINSVTKDPTWILFGTDDKAIDGAGTIEGVGYPVNEVSIFGHEATDPLPEGYMKLAADITFKKLPPEVTAHFTATDVDYFGTLIGNTELTFHTCAVNNNSQPA